MNGVEFLADTNAMIYLLVGNDCMRPYLSKKLGVSFISELELFSFSELTEGEEVNIRNLLKECTVFPLDSDIKEEVISLRKKYRIKLPDAIIAATAIEKGLRLLTADKGFEKIEELQLEALSPTTISV